MRVIVKDGFVTVGNAIYAAGTEVDIPDAAAGRLCADGIVSPADGTASSERVSEEHPAARADTEEELAPAELPSVDPAAAAKKPRGGKE
nr:MAG TPA: hypothetical protein [Caudoviricetes sp.]